MHSKASQTLKRAFAVRGVQKLLSEETGISQTRLSRLGNGDTEPNLENSLKLKDSKVVPVDPSWWALPPDEEPAGASVGTDPEAA